MIEFICKVGGQMNARKNKCSLSILKLFKYLFAICMVFNLRSMWLHSPNYDFIDGYRLLIIMTIICIGCCILTGKTKRKEVEKALILCAFMTMIIVFHLIAAQRYVVYDEVGFLITVCMVILYHSICDTKENLLYDILSNVIFAVAFISLFLWIFVSVLNIIHTSGTIYTTWTATGIERSVSTYYHLYFEPQIYNIATLDLQIVRNTGIFTEAPMYSYVLSVSLLIELFINKEINQTRLIILVLSIVSTFSTLGYIVAITAFTLKFFISQKTGYLIKLFKIFIGPIIVVLSIIIILNFIELKMESLNGTTRIDDFRAAYLAWMEHPILGNGFGNNDIYIKYLSSFRIDNIGLSNSVGLILTYGGVVIFFPYIILFLYGFSTAIKNKDINKIVFILLHSMMFLLTAIPFQAIPLYILYESTDCRNVHISTLSIRRHDYINN